MIVTTFSTENKITVAGKVKIDKEVREIFPVESEVRVKGDFDKNSKLGSNNKCNNVVEVATHF